MLYDGNLKVSVISQDPWVPLTPLQLLLGGAMVDLQISRFPLAPWPVAAVW